MPIIFKNEDLKFSENQFPVPEFSWHTSQSFSRISKSKRLGFDIRSLDSGKYSFPYHFHRNAEELFYIISGEATLRTPDGFSKIKKGDLIFFESGETSAHQLYNHSEDACVYLDIVTRSELGVVEYPDSGKIAVGPQISIFEKSSQVGYFKGEEDVASKWPDHID